jgi:hypothetical protein
MSHLCYIYIFDHQCLRNVGEMFDSRYDYDFDAENKTLTIKMRERNC